MYPSIDRIILLPWSCELDPLWKHPTISRGPTTQRVKITRLWLILVGLGKEDPSLPVQAMGGSLSMSDIPMPSPTASSPLPTESSLRLGFAPLGCGPCPTRSHLPTYYHTYYLLYHEWEAHHDDPLILCFRLTNRTSHCALWGPSSSPSTGDKPPPAGLCGACRGAWVCRLRATIPVVIT